MVAGKDDGRLRQLEVVADDIRDGKSDAFSCFGPPWGGNSEVPGLFSSTGMSVESACGHQTISSD